ncbi:MAG: family 43 glycosylhydrolase [Verrucomicrobia bacterium]|nr:family 43 glycosylhydrolase [Verrucomicrobiota bacterium]
MFSDYANRPPEQTCLDGTPWVGNDGKNWLVYCHEWVQVGDGRMMAVRMKADWTARVGEPLELFKASQAPWVTNLTSALRPGTNNYVTDGPWLYRTKNGHLQMLWSSFGRGGYSVGVAISRTGKVEGPWVQLPDPLFARDGGHCMMFRTFAGQLLLALHQPNRGGQERAKLFEVEENDDRFTLRRFGHGGFLFAHMALIDYAAFQRRPRSVLARTANTLRHIS